MCSAVGVMSLVSRTVWHTWAKRMVLAGALLPALLPVLLTFPPTAVSGLDDSHQYGYGGALVEKPALHQWQEVSETAVLKHQS